MVALNGRIQREGKSRNLDEEAVALRRFFLFKSRLKKKIDNLLAESGSED
jgi:hypothetical protein